MLGGLELVIIAFVFGTLGLWVWSVVDLLGRSNAEWRAIGQDKTMWLLVVLLVGLPGSLAYLLAIRPKLAHLPALGTMPTYPMIGAAPPGWYPDPQGSPMLRWFDGHQWTPHFAAPGGAPMGGAPMGPPPGPWPPR